MKKLASVFLVLLLVSVWSVPVFAATTEQSATSAQATTMRLKKTEGTVTMTNQNGRSLPLKEDSKLYSGYTLTTQKTSYAYVDLDSSKAVKLDEFSTASVKKSGKKLDLSLQSGKLFFNVKEPLKSDESMEIRTATMVTGIRGTAGIVVVPDENTSIFYLLDGEVALTDRDPTTGKTKQVAVKAGEAAISSRVTSNNGTEGTKVQVQKYTEENVSGFAAVEIAKDSNLKEKIKDETGWNVEQIVQQAQETLKRDQEINSQKQQAADNAAASQKQTGSVDALFPNSTPSSGGGSHDNTQNNNNPADNTQNNNDNQNNNNSQDNNDQTNGNNDNNQTGSNTPDGSGTPAVSTKLINATASQINQALEKYTTVSLSGTSGVMDSPIRVAQGKKLRLESGSMNVHSSLMIDGTMEVAAGARLVNNGQIQLGASSEEGSLTIESSGTFLNEPSGTLTNQHGILENKGSFQAKGTVVNLNQLINSGNLKIQANGTLINDKKGSSIGYLKNTGKMAIAASGKIETHSMIETDNPIDNQGAVILSEESLFRSAGGGRVIHGGQEQNGKFYMANGDAVWILGFQQGEDWIGFVSLNSLLAFEREYYGAQNVQYSLGGKTLISEEVEIPEDMNVTLDLAGQELLMGIGCLNNYGTLTIQDSESGGKLETGNSFLTNYGTFTLQSGKLSGISGNMLKNTAGAQMYIKGGSISALKNEIVNEGSAKDLKISGGIIGDDQWGYTTVKGPFTYTGGIVRSKNKDLVCDALPDGWKVSDEADKNGWFTLEKSNNP